MSVPRQVFEYVHPERFVAGTVGEPGQRSFYLQARDGGRVTSVLLEKGQVAALAERITDVLDTLLRRSGGQLPIPAVAPKDHLDLDPLDAPVEAEFRVGTMSLVWDDEDESIVLEAFAVSLDDPDDAPDEDGDAQEDEVDEEEAARRLAELAAAQSRALEASDVMHVVLSGVAARAFAERAERVVSAGRPACPLCNLPLDPQGHVCPRQNGYRRRA
jgi:uncharacterized repeat protein (TIGR03847 family)